MYTVYKSIRVYTYIKQCYVYATCGSVLDACAIAHVRVYPYDAALNIYDLL